MSIVSQVDLSQLDVRNPEQELLFQQNWDVDYLCWLHMGYLFLKYTSIVWHRMHHCQSNLAKIILDSNYVYLINILSTCLISCQLNEVHEGVMDSPCPRVNQSVCLLATILYVPYAYHVQSLAQSWTRFLLTVTWIHWYLQFAWNWNLCYFSQLSGWYVQYLCQSLNWSQII